jgi:hypothetical protein
MLGAGRMQLQRLCRTASEHLDTEPPHNRICIGPRPPQPRAASF